MDRWVVGIIAGFALMFFVNGILVWLAIDSPLEIDETYVQETR